MAEAAHTGSDGRMDLSEHRATFSMFIKATEWGTILIVAGVALLTVAFAMGLGWFAGLLAFAAVTIGAGLLMRMSVAWWATIAATLVLLGIGGAVVGLLVPAAPKAAALALAAFA